jgi:hsp70-interacting protein
MSDERNQPRMNTVQDLFKYAIEHQSTADQGVQSSAASSAVGPLDPERRRFLEEALLASTVDVVDELNKGIAALNKYLDLASQNDGITGEQDEEEALGTIDTLIEWVGQIDFARDFFTLGGYDLLIRLFDCRSKRVQTITFDLAAELLQNNPATQTIALTNGLMTRLITQLQTTDSPQIRVKTIYCLSSLLRGHDAAIEQFLNSDAIDSLVRVLQSRSDESRLCTKVSFLLHSLSSTHSQLLDILLQRGLVDVFVTILQQASSCQAHQFLVETLKNGCDKDERFVSECRRPELQLRSTLSTILDRCKHQEEYIELQSSASELFELCFGSESNEEGER